MTTAKKYEIKINLTLHHEKEMETALKELTWMLKDLDKAAQYGKMGSYPLHMFDLTVDVKDCG